MKRILILLIIATFLISIPLAVANNGSSLSKIVFVYTKEESYAKPPWAGGGKGKNKAEGYEFLMKGYKWKELPVELVVDPDNGGLLLAFVVEAISNGAEEWDSYTTAELFKDSPYTIVHDASWDGGTPKWTPPDGRNELLFDDFPEDGVIAVCVTWFSRVGRRIVEFDIMFDTDFTWGNVDSDGTTVMDLQNIVTHELGHGVGLADLYEDEWSEQTMYGYADYGEIKKRTLESGDIAGIQALYD